MPNLHLRIPWARSEKTLFCFVKQLKKLQKMTFFGICRLLYQYPGCCEALEKTVKMTPLKKQWKHQVNFLESDVPLTCFFRTPQNHHLISGQETPSEKLLTPTLRKACFKSAANSVAPDRIRARSKNGSNGSSAHPCLSQRKHHNQKCWKKWVELRTCTFEAFAGRLMCAIGLTCLASAADTVDWGMFSLV